MPWGDESLASDQAIRRLFKEGVAYHGRFLLLIVRRAEEGPRKVLFVASRKTGHAVRRNRAKRLMRTSYQGAAPRLAAGSTHLAWIARAACPTATLDEVRKDMEGLLARARLYAPTAGHTSSERPSSESARSS